MSEQQARQAFIEWMDEPVDWHFDGAPIKRRVTMDTILIAAVEYGFLAAWNRRAAAVPLTEAQSREAFETHMRGAWPDISVTRWREEPLTGNYIITEARVGWSCWRAAHGIVPPSSTASKESDHG